MDLWPSLENINQMETPKKMLEKQGKYLSAKTSEEIYSICEEIPVEMLREDERCYEFRYSYSIASKRLEGHSFKVLSIYHDITLYPMVIVPDVQIAAETGIERKRISSKAEFEDALKIIFSSKTIENVIGTLINI